MDQTAIHDLAVAQVEEICGVDFRTYGRRQSPCWSRHISTGACHESDRIQGYIENNAVKAGLVANAEDYLWSSAAGKAEMNLGSAGLTAYATLK